MCLLVHRTLSTAGGTVDRGLAIQFLKSGSSKSGW